MTAAIIVYFIQSIHYLSLHYKIMATKKKLAYLTFSYGDIRQRHAITTLEAIPAGVNVDVVII